MAAPRSPGPMEPRTGPEQRAGQETQRRLRVGGRAGGASPFLQAQVWTLGPRAQLSLQGRKPADPTSTLRPREGSALRGRARADTRGGLTHGDTGTEDPVELVEAGRPPSPLVTPAGKRVRDGEHAAPPGPARPRVLQGEALSAMTAAKRRDKQCCPQGGRSVGGLPLLHTAVHPPAHSSPTAPRPCLCSASSPWSVLRAVWPACASHQRPPQGSAWPPSAQSDAHGHTPRARGRHPGARRGEEHSTVARQTPVVSKAVRDTCTAPRFKVKAAARVGRRYTDWSPPAWLGTSTGRPR